MSAQVILDEVIFTPIHIAAFFSYLTLVEGGDWEVRLRIAGSQQCRSCDGGSLEDQRACLTGLQAEAAAGLLADTRYRTHNLATVSGVIPAIAGFQTVRLH